ncbi:MAG: arginase [Bryobacterales bacterium]
MAKTRVKILGVPLDLGQRRRGVDMGPSAIRAAGLQARLREMDIDVEDAGDLTVVIPERQTIADSRARYLQEIAAVCRRAAKRIGEFLDGSSTPLTLGGDHSLAVGTIAGAVRHFRRQKQSLGVIWFDAHADCNTPDTSPSGNVHGMPLAACLGFGPAALTGLVGAAPLLNPANVVLVGVRQIDKQEKEIVRRAGITVFTIRDIDEQGMRRIVEQAIEIASRGTAGFHVSLDMDFLDPSAAPGVGTPCRGGAGYREAHLAMEWIADSQKLRAIEIVEVNPILDVQNQTATLAVELALSAFGKRIL